MLVTYGGKSVLKNNIMSYVLFRLIPYVLFMFPFLSFSTYCTNLKYKELSCLFLSSLLPGNDDVIKC